MSVEFKKNERGEIFVNIKQENGFVLIGRTFRMVDNTFRVDINHYLNPYSKTVLWAFNRIKLSMLNDQGTNGEVFHAYDRHRGVPSFLIHNKPVFIVCPRVGQDNAFYLTNEQGRILSGSNTFDSSGHLCLGGGGSPFSMLTAEALLFNAANRDLTWYGDPIPGKWEDRAAGGKEFHTSSWPPGRQHRDPIVNIPKSLINHGP